MRRQIHIIEIAILFFLLVSCATPSKTQQPTELKPVTPERYFPMQTGFSWTYDVQEYPGPNQTPEQSNLIVAVKSTKEDSALLLSGEKEVTYRFGTEGIAKLPSGNMLLPNQLQVGTSWTVTTSGVVGEAKIVGIEERIATPAGIFEHCLVTEEMYSSEGIKIISVFALDVGLVRVQDYVNVDGQWFLHTQALLRITNVKFNAKQESEK